MAPDFPQHQGRSPGADDGPTHLPEWEVLAVDFLDDRLSPAERALVDAHLATCADCRRELEEQRAMRTVLTGVAPATPPPALGEVVLARLLAAAGPPEADAADHARTAEHSPSLHAPPRAGRGSFVSRLFRPRVWVPAAATLLLAAVLLAQLQPTTGGRVSLESTKNTAAREVTTTAGAAATAPAGAGAGAQTATTMAAASTAATDAAGGASPATTAQVGGPPASAGLDGTFDDPAGIGGPLLSPGDEAPRSVWIIVGDVGDSSTADAARTDQILRSLLGTVSADLPAGTTMPVRTPPLYVTNASVDVAEGLLARMAEAGLDPRVALAPPTLDAALRAVNATRLFPIGSAVGGWIPTPAPTGIVPGGALVLVNVQR